LTTTYVQNQQNNVCLFGNIGAGHLSPMLGLAKILAARGWNVFFYAHANARTKVEATGASWCNYGADDWDLFNTAQWATTNLLSLEAEPLQDLSIVRAAPSATIAMLPHLLRELELRRPAFTVHDAAAPWGFVAARLAGLPSVCSMSAFPMTAEQAVRSYPVGPIQAAACRYLFDQYQFEYDPAASYVNYSDFTLVFTARVWAGNGSAPTAHNFCIAPLDEAASTQHPSLEIARAGKAAGKKIAYLSLGTVVNGTLREYYKPVVHRIFSDVIGALSGRNDVHLIISEGLPNPTSTGKSSFRPNENGAGERVTIFHYLEQRELLPYVDLFVTHAGMNSTNEAAWHGVPVVCCPFFGDGILNAQRFAELGAGLVLNYQIATPAEVAQGQAACMAQGISATTVRDALFAVLDDPKYREAAAALQQQFRTELDLDAAVDRLLTWVETRTSQRHHAEESALIVT
jgi:MGT family glycosyltransferase